MPLALAPVDPITRPVFVVAPPQSGTRFLQGALGACPGVRSLGHAGRWVLDRDDSAPPSKAEPASNRRVAADADPETAQLLRDELRALLAQVSARAGQESLERIVDATPRNALRVPFLDSVFPDASFVYLYREPRDTLAGMLEAWHSGEYVTYGRLPGWEGPPWSLLLTPGWPELSGRPVEEIVTRQWQVTTRCLLDDLGELPPDRWSVVDYAALERDPRSEIDRLCAFLGLEPPDEIEGSLADHVIAPRGPAAAARAERLQPLLPRTTGLAERAHELLAQPVSRRPTPTPDADSPLRSVYTGSFGKLLERLGVSLVATAPRASRVVVIRHDDPRVNTHFRHLPSPTGVAVGPGELAIAAPTAIHRYAAVGEAPSNTNGSNDRVYVPRQTWFTAAAGTTEIAFAGRELWLCSGRLSCLATLDGVHSLVPRWRPPFVSAIADEDRCRLSGLGVVDDRVAYVTALGITDEPEGWRRDAPEGGCLVEVESNEVMLRDLSFPHSPRWHSDRVWFCESGEGAVRSLDPRTGELETLIELPGFVRGLAIAGRTAFVGCSKLRDPDALGVGRRFDEHFCGIYAVDLETGNELAYLRFEEEISEIFGLAVIADARFPELADAGSELALRSFDLPG